MSTSPKSIIVTGGASGIGLAVTQHFASQGHRVAIVDINNVSGPAVTASLAAEFPQAMVTFHKCDVSSWDEQAATFKQIFRNHGDRLDLVMANAGISEGVSTLLRLGDDDEVPVKPDVRAVGVNLLGVVYSVNLAVHYLKKNARPTGEGFRGHIICTASQAGLYPFPTGPLYAASKFGVVGLVRSVAKMLEKAGIQINALAPAALETNISADKEFFQHMTLTPMETLIRAVDQFLSSPSLSGAVAEIHGENMTIRPPHEYVDDESRQNFVMFWKLAYM